MFSHSIPQDDYQKYSFQQMFSESNLDFVMLSEQICFEILLRFWEKVWYRNHYK